MRACMHDFVLLGLVLAGAGRGSGLVVREILGCCCPLPCVCCVYMGDGAMCMSMALGVSRRSYIWSNSETPLRILSVCHIVLVKWHISRTRIPFHKFKEYIKTLKSTIPLHVSLWESRNSIKT